MGIYFFGKYWLVLKCVGVLECWSADGSSALQVKNAIFLMAGEPPAFQGFAGVEMAGEPPAIRINEAVSRISILS